jgi:AraC-like DNA-binding protein
VPPNAAQRRKAAPLGRSAAVWNILYLLAYAVDRGLTRATLIERFELEGAALEDVDGRVPIAIWARMWNELPALLGDPDMPLHVVKHAVMADPPLSVLFFLSSPTLGDAIQRMLRYQRVTFDLASEPASELLMDGEHAHLLLQHERVPFPLPTGALIDSALGILTLARLATGRDVVPVALTFRHPMPRRPEDYTTAFRCPVRFGATQDRLTLRRADLALVHPNASRTLLSIVERHAQRQLSELPRDEDLSSRLRRAIRARLPDGHLALSELAPSLGLSPRTLQRRLEAEGTSLRRLVDEERRALALHHIQDPRTSLVDIAFLLGFADQSAFSRAFSRWTSRPPKEYRERLG